MSTLRTRDLHNALEVALDAQACGSAEELRRALLPGLRRLVPCDLLGYNEIDLARSSMLGVLDPADGGFDGIEQRFLAVAHQHPLVARQRAGDLSCRALSDFLTVRQFHRLELAFGVGGKLLVAFVLCRSQRSFTNRDRQLLEVLRPHIAMAYRRVRERKRELALLDTLEAAIEDRGLGVIQLDSKGRIEQAAGAARALSDAYLGVPVNDGDSLPAALRAPPKALAGPRGSLRITEIRSGDRRGLILEEQRPRPPSIEALRSQGLTRRQAQVLRLLACGKSNRQIAAELGLSTATVEKHLEHVYTRLGVSSRGEATARAYVSREPPHRVS